MDKPTDSIATHADLGRISILTNYTAKLAEADDQIGHPISPAIIRKLADIVSGICAEAQERIERQWDATIETSAKKNGRRNSDRKTETTPNAREATNTDATVPPSSGVTNR
jgi:hypothetical protein